MAREIGGIEILLDLNSTAFERSIDNANDELKSFEKNVENSVGSLDDMLKAQKQLTNALKQTPTGTKEFYKLANQLNSVNRSIETTTMEMDQLNGKFRETDLGGTASRLRGTAGGFADMTRAIGGTNSSLGQTVDGLEQLAIAGSGAFDILQDGSELLGITTPVMGAFAIAIGTATIAYNSFVKAQEKAKLGIKSIAEGVKNANAQLTVFDTSNLFATGTFKFDQQVQGLQGLVDKIQETENRVKELAIQGDSFSDSFDIFNITEGNTQERIRLEGELLVLKDKLIKLVNDENSQYSDVINNLRTVEGLNNKLIVLKANEDENTEEIYNTERKILELTRDRFAIGSNVYNNLTAQITALDIVFKKQKEINEEQQKYANGLVGSANFYENLELPTQDDSNFNLSNQLAEGYLKEANALAELDAQMQANIMSNYALAEANRIRADEQIEKAQQAKEIQTAAAMATIEGLNQVGQAFVQNSELAGTAQGRLVSILLDTTSKLVSMALANSLANSIQGATQAGTATGPAAPFTTPAFIATAVSGIFSAFASIPSFASGGIYRHSEAGQSERIEPLNQVRLRESQNNDRPVVVSVNGKALLTAMERQSQSNFRTQGNTTQWR